MGRYPTRYRKAEGPRNRREGRAIHTRLYRVEPMATLCGLAQGFRATVRQWAAAPRLPSELPLMAHHNSAVAPIFDCWFSKSRQQGAPQLREAASHVIGGDKMIGRQMRCTHVAIAK